MGDNPWAHPDLLGPYADLRASGLQGNVQKMHVAGFEEGGRAISPGMQAAPRTWKSKEWIRP